MKSYERESFLKSIIIFFVLFEALLGIDYWYGYQKVRDDTKKSILLQMHLCAYTTDCEGMQTDFVRDKGKVGQKNILYERQDFYAYFDIPSKRFLMKVVYPKKRYEAMVAQKSKALQKKMAIYSFFGLVLSLLFAWYTIQPLRRALLLNEEFVRDILHDFNTPLASIRVNTGLLKRDIGKDDVRILRIENNIDTILGLQNNLRMFLKEIPTQKERFDIAPLIQKNIEHYTMLFPSIVFDIHLVSFYIETNKEAFSRIVDNLVSNAVKYNTHHGRVKIWLEGKRLYIEDTGKGIASPEKAFERYYKEQDQGIGIGLHVVKKLSDELSIAVTLQSKVDKGTRAIIDLRYVAV